MTEDYIKSVKTMNTHEKINEEITILKNLIECLENKIVELENKIKILEKK